MKRIFLLLLLALVLHHNAQNSAVGNWIMYFGNHAFNSRFTGHTELQYRSYNAGNDLEQLLVRNGIGFNLTSNNNTILVGHAFIYSGNYLVGTNEKSFTKENRLFQQFITKQSFKRFNFQHRYRAEERFFAHHNHIRFRYALSITVPLNSAQFDKNTLYAATTKELFINNPSPSFDRFRLYGAMGYVVNTNLRVELGAMTQFLSQHQRTQFQIAVFNTIDYSKMSSKKNASPEVVNASYLFEQNGILD